VMAESFAPLSTLCRAEANAVGMAEAAMKILIDATSKHATDIKFISQSLAFLANICTHSKASEVVIPTKMLECVRGIMSNHRSDAGILLRALRALENIAYATQPVRDHMKAEKCIEAVEEVKERHNGHDQLMKQCKQVIDAINKVTAELTDQFLLIERPDHRRKKMGDLFGDSDKRSDGLELAAEHKNLLLTGSLLNKHSTKVNPRVRHIYVTPDLKYLVWKDPRKPVDPKQRMKTFKIRQVESGRYTAQLQRKKTFGGYYAKEECSFSVLGGPRTVDLETATELDRDKWVTAMRALISYLHALKTEQSKFTSR